MFTGCQQNHIKVRVAPGSTAPLAAVRPAAKTVPAEAYREELPGARVEPPPGVRVEPPPGVRVEPPPNVELPVVGEPPSEVKKTKVKENP